jgi:hypothetical protein
VKTQFTVGDVVCRYHSEDQSSTEIGVIVYITDRAKINLVNILQLLTTSGMKWGLEENYYKI